MQSRMAGLFGNPSGIEETLREGNSLSGHNVSGNSEKELQTVLDLPSEPCRLKKIDVKERLREKREMGWSLKTRGFLNCVWH